MVFTLDYKERVFEAMQFNPYLINCMEALEKNNANMFRIYMDMAIDEVTKGMEPRILLDEGDRMLWNGIVTQYKALSALYTEFMNEYTKELDSRKVVNHG